MNVENTIPKEAWYNQAPHKKTLRAGIWFVWFDDIEAAADFVYSMMSRGFMAERFGSQVEIPE